MCIAGENGNAEGAESSATSGNAESGGASREPSGTDALTADDSSPVHYFVMGPHAKWESAPAWPPPNLAQQPLLLYLGSASGRQAVSILLCFVLLACLGHAEGM